MTERAGDATPRPGDETPNVARIYDYLLGSGHNFAPDRARAEQIIAVYPKIVPMAWANRSFLRVAVEHALSLGIDQFLDLGSGIPTVGNVHEIAHRHNPAARVAYVDNEPVAVAHSSTLLKEIDNATITDADLRDPDAVLAAPTVAGLLDFTRPVALLAITALHFVSDQDDPGAILAVYRRALAAGSMLALTHVSEDYPEHPEFLAAYHEAVTMYASTSDPLYPRSRAELRAIVEAAGFRINSEGLVDVSRWAPPEHRDEPAGGYALITDPLTD